MRTDSQTDTQSSCLATIIKLPPDHTQTFPSDRIQEDEALRRIAMDDVEGSTSAAGGSLSGAAAAAAMSSEDGASVAKESEATSPRRRSTESVGDGTADRADGSSSRRRSPASPRTEGPPAKRPRRPDVDAAGRSRRMFGLLNQTLSRAKEDNVRRTSGEAGRKRAEIEARLQQKIKQDEGKMREQRELTRRLEGQLADAYALALEIQSTDMAIRLRKAQKRRLGSFLVTPSELADFDGGDPNMRDQTIDRKTLAPAIATVLAPIGRSHPPSLQQRPDAHPVYYLPKKMLPSQDDQLDDQEDAVDEAIDAADIAWEERKAGMRARLDEIRSAVVQTRDDIARHEAGPSEAAQDLEISSST